MLVVALVLRTEQLTHWDSWDYTAQAIGGHSSDLLLGRWWFIGFMRAAYIVGRELFALTRLEGYLAMQLTCALFMAGAVAAGMAWTYKLTRSVTAEVCFAALILLGPMFAIGASSVMTESATLCMLTLSFLAWEKAIAARANAMRWALASGLAFGVMVSMREQAVVLLFWPVVSCLTDKPHRRWSLLAAGAVGTFVTLGFGVFMAARWYPWPDVSYWQNIGRWVDSMQTERGQFAVRPWAQADILATYLFSASPLVALLIVPSLIFSSLRRQRVFWLFVATIPYLITLLINHDLPVNPRFIMPAAWMLAPVAAGGLAALLAVGRKADRRRAVIVAAMSILVVATLSFFIWQGVVVYHFRASRRKAAAFAVMMQMPSNAFVIPGPSTPVAYYLGRMGVKDFDIIASGWGWPGQSQLQEGVVEALSEGREVYANLDPEDWRGSRDNPEWDQLQALAARCELDEATWPMVRLRSIAAEPTTNPTAQ